MIACKKCHRLVEIHHSYVFPWDKERHRYYINTRSETEYAEWVADFTTCIWCRPNYYIAYPEVEKLISELKKERNEILRQEAQKEKDERVFLESCDPETRNLLITLKEIQRSTVETQKVLQRGLRDLERYI